MCESVEKLAEMMEDQNVRPTLIFPLFQCRRRRSWASRRCSSTSAAPSTSPASWRTPRATSAGCTRRRSVVLSYFYSRGPLWRPLVVVLMCGFSNTAEVSFCRVPTSLSSLGLIRRRLSSHALRLSPRSHTHFFCGGPNGMAAKRPRNHFQSCFNLLKQPSLRLFFIFVFPFHGIYTSR